MDGCAFITGCSSGIGLETARYFREKGLKVAATARRPEVLASEESEELVAIACDVTSQESVAAAVKEAEERLGPIDAVVNNAGYGQPGPVEEVTEEELREQFETNVFGVHRVIRATVPQMRERGRGTVINISSLAGRISSPYLGVYSASKYAVEALSDAMRVELRPFGVRVVVVEPGPIRTHFEETARDNTDLLDESESDSPYARSSSSTQRSLKVMNSFTLGPEAVAKVIYRAATTRSPRARYQVTFPAIAGSLASRLMPDSVMDYALSRATGL